jgi:UDP-N-acetylmuramate-alanine ligase
VLNALAATAVCRRVGVPLERIAQILETFTGVRRRFDILARGRVVVVDDYAHHPTEILAVLRAARESLRGRRLVAVFQPHQHSRLKVFREQFADVLARFDAAVVTDVYRARDKDEDAKAVRSDSLVRAINERRPLTAQTRRDSPTFEMLRDVSGRRRRPVPRSGRHHRPREAHADDAPKTPARRSRVGCPGKRDAAAA